MREENYKDVSQFVMDVLEDKLEELLQIEHSEADFFLKKRREMYMIYFDTVTSHIPQTNVANARVKCTFHVVRYHAKVRQAFFSCELIFVGAVSFRCFSEPD